jgi:hypothetical protein
VTQSEKRFVVRAPGSTAGTPPSRIIGALRASGFESPLLVRCDCSRAVGMNVIAYRDNRQAIAELEALLASC